MNTVYEILYPDRTVMCGLVSKASYKYCFCILNLNIILLQSSHRDKLLLLLLLLFVKPAVFYVFYSFCFVVNETIESMFLFRLPSKRLVLWNYLNIHFCAADIILTAPVQSTGLYQWGEDNNLFLSPKCGNDEYMKGCWNWSWSTASFMRF